MVTRLASEKINSSTYAKSNFLKDVSDMLAKQGLCIPRSQVKLIPQDLQFSESSPVHKVLDRGYLRFYLSRNIQDDQHNEDPAFV